MLAELHAVKVLFYAESVGVVTFGHVTKMAVTPFDPPWPNTPSYTQISWFYLLLKRSYEHGVSRFFAKNYSKYF